MRDLEPERRRRRDVEEEPVVAKKIKKGEVTTSKKQAAVVAKPVIEIRPKKASAVLASLADRVTLGEFRGRAKRPDLVMTKLELEALHLGVQFLQNGVSHK